MVCCAWWHHWRDPCHFLVDGREKSNIVYFPIILLYRIFYKHTLSFFPGIIFILISQVVLFVSTLIESKSLKCIFFFLLSENGNGRKGFYFWMKLHNYVSLSTDISPFLLNIFLLLSRRTFVVCIEVGVITLSFNLLVIFWYDSSFLGIGLRW